MSTGPDQSADLKFVVTNTLIVGIFGAQWRSIATFSSRRRTR